MYGLKNVLTKNPVQISGAVMAVVNLLIILSVFTMDGQAVAALNIALSSVLGLFVVANTTNTAKLEELSPDQEPEE